MPQNQLTSNPELGEFVVTKDGPCCYWVRRNDGSSHWPSAGRYMSKFFAIRRAKQLNAARLVNQKEILVWSPREAHKPRTVTHIPDSSGLTLPQLEAGKQALYSCSEDPSFDDVRAVIAAVAQSNPTK